MRRRILLLILFGLTSGAVYRVAKSFTLPKVNYVVYHTFHQKAPGGLSPEEAGLLFDRAFQSASRSPESQKAYLQDLFRISQKMEKVQKLSTEEANELLDYIRFYTREPQKEG